MHTPPDPVIETPRLLLRRLTPSDAAWLHPILSDPLTMRFWPQPFTRQQTEEWIERNLGRYQDYGYGRYGMILRETGEPIGDAGIVRTTVNGLDVYDLGYIIHHPWWGKGLATEAAAALRDYGFGTLDLPALHANMAHDHHGSRHVAEKIGMSAIAEFNNERNRGIRTTLLEMTASDYMVDGKCWVG